MPDARALADLRDSAGLRLRGIARTRAINADNHLLGRAGDDTLIGGAGNDTLQGDAGADMLTGGDGADRFVFGDGDTVTDFEDGSDMINISALDHINADNFETNVWNVRTDQPGAASPAGPPYATPASCSFWSGSSGTRYGLDSRTSVE